MNTTLATETGSEMNTTLDNGNGYGANTETGTEINATEVTETGSLK